MLFVGRLISRIVIDVIAVRNIVENASFVRVHRVLIVIMIEKLVRSNMVATAVIVITIFVIILMILRISIPPALRLFGFASSSLAR